jgi:hypothetical protein
MSFLLFLVDLIMHSMIGLINAAYYSICAAVVYSRLFNYIADEVAELPVVVAITNLPSEVVASTSRALATGGRLLSRLLINAVGCSYHLAVVGWRLCCFCGNKIVVTPATTVAMWIWASLAAIVRLVAIAVRTVATIATNFIYRITVVSWRVYHLVIHKVFAFIFSIGVSLMIALATGLELSVVAIRLLARSIANVVNFVYDAAIGCWRLCCRFTTKIFAVVTAVVVWTWNALTTALHLGVAGVQVFARGILNVANSGIFVSVLCWRAGCFVIIKIGDFMIASILWTGATILQLGGAGYRLAERALALMAHAL